ncbi:MAG: hypothetical protein MPJ22_11225, partial [Pirellulales bacterium]|nr:hypothetical protein [Pirellulales bacterium]
VLTIRYVSDGLSPNIQDIKVPKQAEAAIEAMVRFELLDQSDKVTLYNKQRAQRRKAAEYNNAKIRISDYGLRNLIQQLKGKRRWIKV